MQAKYKRVLIKISGEALAAEKKTGYDFDFVMRVCNAVKDCAAMGAQVGIVIGGGNFWRGVKDGAGHVERVSADRMGMLATAINCLAVADVFRKLGTDARVMTAVDIQGVGERYDTKKAIEYLEGGKIVLFGCGTGMPFFSTDTAAVLRAAEIGADVVLMAKNIDGVYNADPKVDPQAVKFEHINYSEILSRHLKAIDTTATSFSMDNSIPILVFGLDDPQNIVRAVKGEKIGTIIEGETK